MQNRARKYANPTVRRHQMTLRKIHIYILLAVSFVTACNQVETNRQEELPPYNKATKPDETAIYRVSDPGLDFELKIDSFHYHETDANRDITMGYKIGVVKKQQNHLSEIKLTVNGQDTSFRLPLYKVDSIMFGPRRNGKFFIATDREANAWIID